MHDYMAADSSKKKRVFTHSHKFAILGKFT